MCLLKIVERMGETQSGRSREKANAGRMTFGVGCEWIAAII